jgi:excisionase family DNA binding protein
MAATQTPPAQLTLDELMTCSDVAELLLMRESTVAEYARRGLLPSFKVGRHRRFVRRDVVGAIERLRNDAPC